LASIRQPGEAGELSSGDDSTHMIDEHSQDSPFGIGEARRTLRGVTHGEDGAVMLLLAGFRPVNDV